MSRKKTPQKRHVWQPMRPVERMPVPLDRAEALAKQHGFTVEDATRALEAAAEGEMFRNDRYTVIATRREDGSIQELSIRRNDRKPIRDWRDFQRIKNEIAGAEAEAVELYPAMSRIMDTANQYYLWVLPPGQQFRLGYQLGPQLIDHQPGVGSVQRDIPADWREDTKEI